MLAHLKRLEISYRSQTQRTLLRRELVSFWTEQISPAVVFVAVAVRRIIYMRAGYMCGLQTWHEVWTTFARNEQLVCVGSIFLWYTPLKKTCKCQESSMKLQRYKSKNLFAYKTQTTKQVWKPSKFSLKTAVITNFPFCKSLPFFYFLTFEKGRLLYIHHVGRVVGWSVGWRHH